MRMMGVDPGLSGALALIDTETGEIVVDDMPLVELSRKRVRSKRTGKTREKVKRCVDGRAVGDWIDLYQPDEAIVEHVASMPKQGVVSTFAFGESFGAVCGAIEAMNVRLHRVRPAVWKRGVGLIGAGKGASLALARKTYSQAAKRLKRKRDDGRAEALLIAQYALAIRRAQRGTGNRRT